MPEKRNRPNDLKAFRTAFDTEDKLKLTGSALKGAAAIGFGRVEIVATIQSVRRSTFTNR
jgi:motility quorum-sensing regulator/GCU-specific mRNA interferase toxin